MARAHLAWAENRLVDCIATLRARRDQAMKEQREYFALRLTTPLAVACWRANDPVEAANLFHRAMSLAAPAGMHQLILDSGPETLSLLLRLRDGVGGAGPSRELLPYVDDVIGRCREAYPAEPVQGPASVIAEALSPRERKVLELLGEGQSNKDIARTLSIAPETVKSHVKNIFMKLGVERRTQAVARALSLGLVRTG